MLIRFKRKDKNNRTKLQAFLKKNPSMARITLSGPAAAVIEELKEGSSAALSPLLEAVFPGASIHLSPEELFPQALKSSFELGKSFAVIAGPCAIESKKSYLETAAFLSGLGIKLIRAPLFKPRKSTYCFQGLGEEGFAIIAEARARYGIRPVTEILSSSLLPEAEKYCDIIQIGARNMRNYELIKAASMTGKPMIIKRAQGAGIKEWMMSAEYAAVRNKKIIFCERGEHDMFQEGGINFNLAARAKKDFGITVIADASHSSLGSDLVEKGVLAALIFGLDGAMIEIHKKPEAASVDGKHAISFHQFEKLLRKISDMEKCLKK